MYEIRERIQEGLENGPVAVLRACAHKYTDNCLLKFTPRYSANNWNPPSTHNLLRNWILQKLTWIISDIV